MKNITLLILISLIATPAIGDITYQVIANPATGQVQQSDTSLLADGSLLRVGFFDEVALGLISDLTNFSAVDAAFTETTTFGSLSGNFGANVDVPAQTEGEQLYWWVFNGPDGAIASQSGIFTADIWTIPADLGTSNMVSSSIGVTGVISGGQDGINYTLTNVVPEPAHFAAVLGALGLGLVMWNRRRR